MSTEETTSEPGRLVELLRHQNVLYRRLRLLADRQKAMVAADDAKPLLGLLAERQKLVDGLIGLNGQLTPFRNNWTEVYNGLDESMRKDVAQLLEEANAALGLILHSDQQDTAKLEAKRQDVAGRLDALETGSAASAAYSSAGLGASTGVTDEQA